MATPTDVGQDTPGIHRYEFVIAKSSIEILGEYFAVTHPINDPIGGLDITFEIINPAIRHGKNIYRGQKETPIAGV